MDAVSQEVGLPQARSGRRKVAFFDAAAYGDPSSNLSLMSSMLQGLKSGEIELHHQPKYDLRRGVIGGVECLARWRHPTRFLRLRPDLHPTDLHPTHQLPTHRHAFCHHPGEDASEDVGVG